MQNYTNTETDLLTVPYIVHEGEMARAERAAKRLIILLVITIIMLAVSNGAWLYAWMQYDYVGEEITTQTVDVDAKDGIANYIGNDGDIINGKDYGDNDYPEAMGEDEEQQPWQEG